MRDRITLMMMMMMMMMIVTEGFNAMWEIYWNGDVLLRSTNRQANSTLTRLSVEIVHCGKT